MSVTTQQGRPKRLRDQPLESGTLLLATMDGRIGFATGRASEWLREYFAPRANAAYLPKPMLKWLLEQKSPLAVFTAPHQPKELQVSIIRSDADGAFCLLLAEKPLRHACLRMLLGVLTPREADVLVWLGEAKSNAEIAEILKIELATVKKHLQNIFIKLGVHNRLAAASFLAAIGATRRK